MRIPRRRKCRKLSSAKVLWNKTLIDLTKGMIAVLNGELDNDSEQYWKVIRSHTRILNRICSYSPLSKDYKRYRRVFSNIIHVAQQSTISFKYRKFCMDCYHLSRRQFRLH